jgi:hypothetical protein
LIARNPVPSQAGHLRSVGFADSFGIFLLKAFSRHGAGRLMSCGVCAIIPHLRHKHREFRPVKPARAAAAPFTLAPHLQIINHRRRFSPIDGI